MAKRLREANGRFKKSPTENGRSITTGNFPAQNRFQVGNEILTRSQLINKLLDPRRDIYAECGYPAIGQLGRQFYNDLYEREAIATRVVEVLPKESWQTTPEIFETEDVEQDTEFELAWKDLVKTLTGGSHYNNVEEGNPIWEYLERVDILSGIGHYGAVLLGINDGKDLREEAVVGENTELLFVRSFSELLVEIANYDTEPTSPRFGHPTEYSVTLNDPNNAPGTGLGFDTTTRQVHWTRIIHIADNLNNSELFGVPRLRPVYNRIYDLMKLYSGSGEMYWRGAFPGLSIETHPQLGTDVTIDQTALAAKMLDYHNGLQRYLAVSGASTKSLAPQVVDPTPQVNTQLDAICIQLGIPKRIFVGSERGELASSQDDSSWNDRLRHRQNSYLTPRVIVPFIDRLIMLGVLPAPAEENGYNVRWPDLDSLTDTEKAMILTQRTESIVKYVSGGGEQLITPIDYLTKEMDYSNDEADEILGNTMEHIEEIEEKEEAVLDREAERVEEKVEKDLARDMIPLPGKNPPPQFSKNEQMDQLALNFDLSPTERNRIEAEWEQHDEEDS
ncbi:DUF1073 domain-containing protein [bacterium]|nr:DUF1073 domain-containing protein [bacterium]